ncbi:hypothetical protein BBJ28_00027085, partial [Nothophytophthora sp. Chile5]
VVLIKSGYLKAMAVVVSWATTLILLTNADDVTQYITYPNAVRVEVFALLDRHDALIRVKDLYLFMGKEVLRGADRQIVVAHIVDLPVDGRH